MFRVTIGGETHCVIRGLIRWLMADGGRVLVGGGRISQQGNVVGLGALQAVAHFHCSVAAVLRGVVDVLPAAAAVVVVRPRQLDSNGNSGTPLGISSGGAIKLNVVSQSIADSHFAIRVEILFSIHSARGTGWIFVFVCFFVCGSGIVWCVTWLEGVTANCTAQEAYLRCV